MNCFKIQVIVIGSGRMISKIKWFCPQVMVEGTAIQIRDTVKNLNVIFDRYVSWGLQLNATSLKGGLEITFQLLP